MTSLLIIRPSTILNGYNEVLDLFDLDKLNGRYVRNIIEKVKMDHATRLLNMGFDLVGKGDIVTICAEDIEAPPVKSKKVRNPIGFSVA